MSYNARGFSLVELLLAVLITSMGIMVLLQSVTSSTTRMDRIRKDVIATNLAREGVEAMYNIRDSNRQRRAQNDGCWLKIDPLIDTDNAGCLDDPWFYPGRYTIKNQTGDDIGYRYATRISDTDSSNNALTLRDTNGYDDSIDKNYILCQKTTAPNRRFPCPDKAPGQTNSPEGTYFRGIEVKELRDKRENDVLTCKKGGEGGDCNYPSPKELIFCVHVEYIGGGIGHKELCASMTNFAS